VGDKGAKGPCPAHHDVFVAVPIVIRNTPGDNKLARDTIFAAGLKFFPRLANSKWRPYILFPNYWRSRQGSTT
jgi:hypothetical protein